MKYIFIILCLAVLQSCVKGRSERIADSYINEEVSGREIPKENIQGAYLNVDKWRYNFGTVHKKKMSNIQLEFNIENAGKLPLVILKADVSCSCLSVDYSSEPILPGKKARLSVNIDTQNQAGTFNKTIFIKSNADNNLELIRIIGEIKD